MNVISFMYLQRLFSSLCQLTWYIDFKHGGLLPDCMIFINSLDVLYKFLLQFNFTIHAAHP
jgi:hypothetical protein